MADKFEDSKNKLLQNFLIKDLNRKEEHIWIGFPGISNQFESAVFHVICKPLTYSVKQDQKSNRYDSIIQWLQMVKWLNDHLPTSIPII